MAFIAFNAPISAFDEVSNNDVDAENSESYIPANLDDAIRHLKETLPSEDIEFLRTADERDIASLHFGFGMGLRNSWGLWGGSRFADWFNSIGIFHADDMSGIIIRSLIRDLRGEPIELDVQVEGYVEYWAEAEDYSKQEELEELEREKRRNEAKLSWQWIPNEAVEVVLPRQPEWQEIWGLHEYDGGFLVVAKGYRSSYSSIWHDGVYFLSAPTGQLEKVIVNGCARLHDVIVRNESASWLCQAYQGDWTIVTTTPGRPDIRRALELPHENDWMRLGRGESGLLLVSADRVYRDSTSGWEVIYQARSPVRDYNLFDYDDDFHEENHPDPFLPHRSALPVEHGGHIYFLVEDTGNESALYRIDLNEGGGDLENAQHFLSWDYLGNWGFHVSDISIDDQGTLWIASQRLGVLFSVDKDGKIGVASFRNNIDFSGPIDELKAPSDWRENLPIGAVLHTSETIILAGIDGIASVQNGAVQPIVRFVYPDGMDRVPYTSRPQYDYHLKPQRLGGFEDGSFVLGDRFDGLYVLVKEDNGYRLTIPAVMQTTREIGTTADDQ